MTTQEAIKQLDGAEALLFNRNMKAFNQAIIMAIAALQEKAEREDQKPLTIEELKPLDGEPVYIVEIHGREEWLFRRDGGFADVYGDFTFDEDIEWDNYGRLWWAYRNKPKEEAE